MSVSDVTAFATARQLAKLQYWATRALGLEHGSAVDRAQTVIVEFCQDLGMPAGAADAWWTRVSGELEALDAPTMN